MPQADPRTIQYAVTALVIGLVLFLRYRGMRRARRLRLETLWIVPALFGFFLAAATWEYPPPTALGWLWLALAIVGGGVIGWYRGKLMRITVDPVTHRLNQQSSPAAFLFIVLLIVARQGLRYEAASLHVDILKITGILLAAAFGATAASRGEMFLRARRMLVIARAS